MVQEHVRRDELEALLEVKGVYKRYYVSIGSLNVARERRNRAAKNARSLQRFVVVVLSGESQRRARRRRRRSTASDHRAFGNSGRRGQRSARPSITLTEKAESTLREQLKR